MAHAGRQGQKDRVGVQGLFSRGSETIRAPVLVTIGDRDSVRPEHAAEMFRLIPNAQLAIFPGADHFLLLQSPDKLFATITAFLDSPVPEPK